MRLVDTHAHLHSTNYQLDPDQVIEQAKSVGVEKIICVGTNSQDSRRVVEFVKNRPTCFASVGLHPHDAKDGQSVLQQLRGLTSQPKVVAIGECGLDYHYHHSPKDIQKQIFRQQIELALELSLPVIFHLREASNDFYKIIDQYSGIRGVVHSFNAGVEELSQILKRNFYVSINGIVTFTKESTQIEAAKQVPLERLVLETDAPFLTPVPKRGTVNESGNVRIVAEFLAYLRGGDPEELAKITSQNACSLFNV